MLETWHQLLSADTPSLLKIRDLFGQAVKYRELEWIKRILFLRGQLPDDGERDFFGQFWQIAFEYGPSTRVLKIIRKQVGLETVPQGLASRIEIIVSPDGRIDLEGSSGYYIRTLACLAIRKRRPILLTQCLSMLGDDGLSNSDLAPVFERMDLPKTRLEKILQFLKNHPFASDELLEQVEKMVVKTLYRRYPWPAYEDLPHLEAAWRRHSYLMDFMEPWSQVDKTEALRKMICQGVSDENLKYMVRCISVEERSRINIGELVGICEHANRSQIGIDLIRELGSRYIDSNRMFYQILAVMVQVDSSGTRLSRLIQTCMNMQLDFFSTQAVALLIVGLSFERQEKLDVLRLWTRSLALCHLDIKWRPVLLAALRTPEFSDGGLPELVLALMGDIFQIGSREWNSLRRVEGLPVDEVYVVARNVIEKALRRRQE